MGTPSSKRTAAAAQQQKRTFSPGQKDSVPADKAAFKDYVKNERAKVTEKIAKLEETLHKMKKHVEDLAKIEKAMEAMEEPEAGSGSGLTPKEKEDEWKKGGGGK